jgi:hypothetical protein
MLECATAGNDRLTAGTAQVDEDGSETRGREEDGASVQDLHQDEEPQYMEGLMARR